MPDRRSHLRVLPDRVPDLTVEDDPVGDPESKTRVVSGQERPSRRTIVGECQRSTVCSGI